LFLIFQKTKAVEFQRESHSFFNFITLN